MSVTQQALTAGRAVAARPARRAWHGGLMGSEYVWAIAFALPYVAVFFAFVLYPIVYGLWLGSQPELYSELFADPALPDRGRQHAAVCRHRRER